MTVYKYKSMKKYFNTVLLLLLFTVECTQMPSQQSEFEEVSKFLQESSNLPQSFQPNEVVKWDTLNVPYLNAKMYRVVEGITRCTSGYTVLMDVHHKKYRWYSGVPELHRTGHRANDYQNSDRIAEEVINKFLADNLCLCEQLTPAIYRMLAFNHKAKLSKNAFFSSDMLPQKKALNDTIIPLLKVLEKNENDILLFNKKLDTLIANYDFNLIYGNTVVVGYRVICDDTKKKAFLVSRILNPLHVHEETVVHKYVK